MAMTAEKSKAHRAVAEAVKAGTLTPGSCSFCGTAQSVVGHHSNYAHPLAVEWICKSHHALLHASLRYYENKWGAA